MLNDWKDYLLLHLAELKSAEDFAYLYEKFVAEFPTLRKFLGIYYTPQKIIEYIVQKTVGKLIAQKTPEQISHIKILDPACGSGSFLLGAYQYLLNYHQEYYTQKNPKNSPINQQGELTTQEKRRILLNNIFGVDIDLQAVEVTKLSLLIRAMEGETQASIETSLKLFHQKVLPNLDNNILAGNSLISPDFEGLNLSPKEERKINVFDWKTEFKPIFQNGGFDIVIGNPPYVSSKEIPVIQKNYFHHHYNTAVSQYDLYTLFIEKGLQMLKENGLFSYIIPDAILDRSSASVIRKYLLDTGSILSITQVNGVFEQANVASVMLVLSKQKTENPILDFFKYHHYKQYLTQNSEHKSIEQKAFYENDYYNFLFIDKQETQLLRKIFAQKESLGSIAFLGRGEEIGKKSEIILDKSTKNTRPILLGEDIHRYSITYAEHHILIDNIKKSHDLYQNKIVVRQVGKNINAAFDGESAVTVQSVYSIIPNKEQDMLYILAILNAKLLNFVYQVKYKSKEIFPRILLESLRQLPIKIINLNDKTEKSLYENIIKRVEKIIQFKKELTAARLQQKTLLQRKINFAEQEIDAFVYQLYSLSAEQIAIVEKYHA